MRDHVIVKSNKRSEEACIEKRHLGQVERYSVKQIGWLKEGLRFISRSSITECLARIRTFWNRLAPVAKILLNRDYRGR
jgi:hypothetical protein